MQIWQEGRGCGFCYRSLVHSFENLCGYTETEVGSIIGKVLLGYFRRFDITSQPDETKRESIEDL